eukprot:GEZU01025470.1.p3 GENE.GEZU01025470.1~~GEZU01025470.1.p3  ORF type:complete len:117 (+),score=22.00 GEZU01025470.1:567-917(+)
MIGLALMLFFLNGHVRYLFDRMRWTRTRLSLFKIAAGYGVLCYLSLGVVTFLHSSYQDSEQDEVFGFNRDLLLLFIFSALSYALEIFFETSRFEEKFKRQMNASRSNNCSQEQIYL